MGGAGIGIGTEDLEAIERDAYSDFWDAAPADLRDGLGLARRRVGDGVALFAAGLGGSMIFNRLLGYGLADARAEDLDPVIDAFEASGVAVWVLQVAPAAAALATLAVARGFEPHPRPWVKFVRGAEPASAASTLDVLPAGPDAAGAFGATFCAAFGVPALLAPWIAALPGRPRWRCFLAWDADAPVATGALYLGARGLGWLGFGGTLPSHRGRGAQQALLAARIEAGRAEGCRGFATETGAPVAGEPAPSYRNILRAGFTEAYTRPNLHRPRV